MGWSFGEAYCYPPNPLFNLIKRNGWIFKTGKCVLFTIIIVCMCLSNLLTNCRAKCRTNWQLWWSVCGRTGECKSVSCARGNTSSTTLRPTISTTSIASHSPITFPLRYILFFCYLSKFEILKHNLSFDLLKLSPISLKEVFFFYTLTMY